MSNARTFKQRLATVSRRWEKEDYDHALAEVDRMREAWPGNAHLHILWASLVQLQETPMHTLDDAKKALGQAAEFAPCSPAASIELGHFADSVEDDPRASVKFFSEAVTGARQLLIEGLTGQAKALSQLGQRQEFLRCVSQLLDLLQWQETPAVEKKQAQLLESASGRVFSVHVKGPFPEEVEDLLHEAIESRSA
ncbi:MAG: hypothetical protein U0793_03295 [Gemmataceae bacterium]